jgi:putative transposase
MLVLEAKLRGKEEGFNALDEAIRTTQFVRNKCLRLWMDEERVGKNDLQKYCAVLAKEFEFTAKLNSQARQAAAERAWFAIRRFYDNCKAKKPGQKGYPKFQKDCRSVEYKKTGWRLSDDRRSIAFTDGFKAGTFKLLGTRDFNFYQVAQIQRVRVVRRADGYYCQFLINVERQEEFQPTGKQVGIDLGLHHFFKDSDDNAVENPRFLRKSEKVLKRLHKRVSRKKKGSANRRKARKRLAKVYLKVSRQRKDHAIETARALVQSNDLIAYEDLQVKNLVRNHHLAKSISDASWSMFTTWLVYFCQVYGKWAIAVAPQYTSQDCHACGARVKKSLSTRTHKCRCGTQLCRDTNAARNILNRGLSTVGRTETNA